MSNLKQVATFKDDTSVEYDLENPDDSYNHNIDTKFVKRYFFQNGDNVIFGVDIENRLFVIGGVVLQTDLPDGDYELISFKRVQEHSNDTKNLFYVLGLKANIDGVNHQRLVSLDPLTGLYKFLLDK